MTTDEISTVRPPLLLARQSSVRDARRTADRPLATGSRPRRPLVVPPLVHTAMLGALRLGRRLVLLFHKPDLFLLAPISTFLQLSRRRTSFAKAEQGGGPAHHARAGLGRRRGRLEGLLRLAEPGPARRRRRCAEFFLSTSSSRYPPGGARYPLVAIPSPRLHSHLPRTRSRRPQLQPLLGARRRASLSQSGHHTREGKLARSLWTAARRSTLVVRSSDRGRLASPPRLSTSARSPCCAEL